MVMGINAKSFGSANDISSPVSRSIMGFHDENTISIEATSEVSKQSLESAVSVAARESYQPIQKAIVINAEEFKSAVPDSMYIGIKEATIGRALDFNPTHSANSIVSSLTKTNLSAGTSKYFYNTFSGGAGQTAGEHGFVYGTMHGDGVVISKPLELRADILGSKIEQVKPIYEVSSESIAETLTVSDPITSSEIFSLSDAVEVVKPALANDAIFTTELSIDSVSEPVVTVEVEPIQSATAETSTLISIRAAVIVAEVNDAPVVSSSSSFASITEDQTSNSGQLVSEIVSVSDADSNASAGIAIHTVDSGNGIWQYSIDSGATWVAVGQVSSSSALLLRAVDMLRLIPDSENADSGNVQFYAWDQTSGTAGGYADASTRGTTSAFSSDTATSSITITAVNDAPTSPSATNFTEITEDQTSSAGQLVSSIASSSDVDAGASSGIAVHTVVGTWEFSTDGGTSWTQVANAAEDNALLLQSTDKLRVIPDGSNAGSGSVSFYAWDQTSGTAGGYADASTRGTTSAFSSDTATSSITITAV
ncbi:MAG: hypothetical protein P1U63_12840, partial [Coxiellaceae bacterium]|nr:hypothetical protein [Coxiellaceae bacterium]